MASRARLYLPSALRAAAASSCCSQSSAASGALGIWPAVHHSSSALGATCKDHQHQHGALPLGSGGVLAKHSRSYASSPVDHSKQVDEINELFATARDEIEMAREDQETVYFNEAFQEAKAATDQVLAKWAALLGSVTEDERHRLQRAMGMKIEQLKAEFSLLESHEE